MARAAAVVLLALLVVAETSAENNVKYTSDNEFIRWQEFLFQIFWKSDEVEKYFPKVVEKAKKFKVEDLRHMPVDQTIAEEFIERYNYGLVPPDRSATCFNVLHLAEIKNYSDLMLSVREFEAFAMIAFWGRNAINRRIWFFALASAVRQRPDTRHITMPNHHEVLPDYAYNSDVVEKWKTVRNSNDCSPSIKKHVISGRYSSVVEGGIDDREARITYFTEDVGLNNYYFYASMELPLWMNTRVYNLSSFRRGERYFFHHYLLLTRYNLERLTNGLDEIEDIDWDQKIRTGYYPTNADYNGVKFSIRLPNSTIPPNKYKYALMAKQYEDRLAVAADAQEMLVKDAQNADTGNNGVFNDLMNAAQGNADSVNIDYYGSLEFVARHILGFNPEPLNKFNLILSTLENYSVDKRDPAFYRMYKKIIDIGLRYKSHLKPYSRKELEFPGVRIEHLSTDKLETFFNQFDSLLGYQNCTTKKLPILARQNRLNHKGFAVHLKIQSEKSTKAVIRIFLGPKYSSRGYELDIDESHYQFYQLDQFVLNLKQGLNNIQRNDSDFAFHIEEQQRSDIIYSHIQRAANGKELLAYREQPYGIPRRLMLPKGKSNGGLPLRLFAIVSPLHKDQVRHVDALLAGMEFSDGRTLGFPLDRPIEAYRFRTSNMAFKDVSIHHSE